MSFRSANQQLVDVVEQALKQRPASPTTLIGTLLPRSPAVGKLLEQLSAEHGGRDRVPAAAIENEKSLSWELPVGGATL